MESPAVPVEGCTTTTAAAASCCGHNDEASSSPSSSPHQGSGYCDDDGGNNANNVGVAAVISSATDQILDICYVDEAAAIVADAGTHPSASAHQNDEKNNCSQLLSTPMTTATIAAVVSDRQKFLLCRRFKDPGFFRNFNSLPLFVYATSTARTTSGAMVTNDGIYRRAANTMNESFDLERTPNSGMDCMPLASNSHHHHLQHQHQQQHHQATAVTAGAYQHHHPYTNYHLHHISNSSSNQHHHIQPEQTKSLQELQNEVGALLEFRDLVIETFPDLKHKMASMSASASASVSGSNTLTGLMSNSSLASRREWEPGIRIKRKIIQKEPSTSSVVTASIAGSVNAAAVTTAAAGSSTSAASTSQSAVTASTAITGEQLSSSSLSRSRSNSHSGKKEPKSGENNGSVVQDSGFSTETSSSKEGHSASSTSGAMTGTIISNRLAFPESDDELLNLLDVIHRKSNRLREEVEHLQNYEREKMRGASSATEAVCVGDGDGVGDETTATNNNSKANNSSVSGSLTPKTFREHIDRLNKEDIKQLRKERDRLLDKLAEMEAETLTGRIRATKMSDQVEELISVKKDLEEQLKIALSQKLELNSRLHELNKQQQQQQIQQHSKSSSSQSDYSSQRNFLSSANTVLSAAVGTLPHRDNSQTAITVPSSTASSSSSNLRLTSTIAALKVQQQQLLNTFQPVVVEPTSRSTELGGTDAANRNFLAFHQSASSSDTTIRRERDQPLLGRLDGVVSSPGAGRMSKVRVADSKKFAAILLETSVVELQRHLLTLTVQNQVLSQKLEQATKSKVFLAKRLDKSKEDVDDLRFQLEEKNIELEGTKAQLRVLEARVCSTTSSYTTHSHQDHEANRSASTTLVMSSTRRDDDESPVMMMMMMRPTTPAPLLLLPSPPPPPLPSSQISTPSMKAMVHLPMDEVQQHSSSTESAHDQTEREQQHQHHNQRHIINGMSASVGGTSPFETPKRSKPSKIPLPPGTKGYFAPKPPSGRSSYTSSHHMKSHSGSSPSTTTGTIAANLSNTSSSSSNKSLSRSTGNLFGRSPHSLKRPDSAQSIRKDNNNSSMSTTASRSSTSSIPIASSAAKSIPSPPQKVLTNSPLPKLKRDSLTSRIRHLDSLSRVYHHHQQSINVTPSQPLQTSTPTTAAPPPSATATTDGDAHGHHHQYHNNSSTASSSSSLFMGGSGSGSTPNSSSSTAGRPIGGGVHHTSTISSRKDLSSSSFSHGQFLRKHSTIATTGAAAVPTTRRFSSASTGRGQRSHDLSAGGGGGVGGGGGNFNTNGNSSAATNATATALDQQQQQPHNDSDSGKISKFFRTTRFDLGIPYENKKHLHQLQDIKSLAKDNNDRPMPYTSDPITQLINRPLPRGDPFKPLQPLRSTGIAENAKNRITNQSNFYADQSSHMTGNLLVTFDYGLIEDSKEIIDQVVTSAVQQPNSSRVVVVADDDDVIFDSQPDAWQNLNTNEKRTLTHSFSMQSDQEENDEQIWFCQPQVMENKSNFKVYRMQHSSPRDDWQVQHHRNGNGGGFSSTEDALSDLTEDDDDEEDFYDSIDYPSSWRRN